MTEKKTGREYVTERLHEAIDGLRKDVTRVEIWATALLTFTQPVPDYPHGPEIRARTAGRNRSARRKSRPGSGSKKPPESPAK